MSEDQIKRIPFNAPFRRYEDFNIIMEMHRNAPDLMDEDYDFSKEPKMLGNEEFIEMIEKTQAVKPFERKLETMFGNTGQAFMFNEVIFLINGGEYKYGINLRNPPAYPQKVGDFLLNKLVEKDFEYEKGLVANGAARHETNTEKLEYLNGKLNNVTKPYVRFNHIYGTGGGEPSKKLTSFVNGYNAEKEKGKPVFDAMINDESFEWIKTGVVARKLERFIKVEIDNLSVETEELANTDSGNMPFSTIPAAVIFFKQTGLYDSLVAKFPNKAEVARIIGLITGKKPSTIEGLLGKIDFNEKNDIKNNPYTDRALSEVIEIFHELNIDTTELHEMKRKITKNNKN